MRILFALLIVQQYCWQHLVDNFGSNGNNPNGFDCDIFFEKWQEVKMGRFKGGFIIRRLLFICRMACPRKSLKSYWKINLKEELQQIKNANYARCAKNVLQERNDGDTRKVYWIIESGRKVGGLEPPPAIPLRMRHLLWKIQNIWNHYQEEGDFTR